jgi:hypothetical protein
MKRQAVGVVLAGMAFFLALQLLPNPTRSAAGGEKKASGEDHDFGDKVLLVVIKPAGNSRLGIPCIEKARVRVLGDKYFVVGRVPDYGDLMPDQVNKGDVLWVPMSEVAMISEHDSVKSAFNSARGIFLPTQEPPKPDAPQTQPSKPKSGTVLAALSFVLSANRPRLTGDVFEINSRGVRLPVKQSEAARGRIKQIRFFVSKDQGKSWRHEGDAEPTDTFVEFHAPEDGLYWFSLQVVYKDGTREPADLKNLSVDKKVFLNTSGKPAPVQKSHSELVRENEELRKKLKELENKLAEPELGRKPK